MACQIPGANPAMFPNMFPSATGQVQATRHARQVYVGGLPPTANEQSVATFFSEVMAAIGGNTAGPGDAVVNVCINHEKKFAFVEMRSMEEASNVLALDGIIFEGAPVKVSRPGDYNPSLTATLGPSQPNPKLNMAAVGLTPGSAGGLEGPADHIFVGGFPYNFTEAHIRKLLEPFGPLRCLEVISGRETATSKGYALCVYQDLSITDAVCAALNGMKMGDTTLTVRRANQGANQPIPEQESVLSHAKQQTVLQEAPVQVSRPSDHNQSLAATFGPSQPNSKLNMASVGLTPGSAGGLEGPADRIFLGGFPYYCTEAHIRILLEVFGPLRRLEVIRDGETAKSKVYAFCVYQDLSVTDAVCATLNGIKMGDATLTVRRENQPNSEEERLLLRIALQRLMLQPGSIPTKVLCLSQVVTAGKLKDDDEYYEDILEDMGQAGKFGTLVNVVIPQPNPNGEPSPGVGKVFLEYADIYGAIEAQKWLNGRKYGGNQVVAVLYPENKFAQGDYEG